MIISNIPAATLRPSSVRLFKQNPTKGFKGAISYRHGVKKQNMFPAPDWVFTEKHDALQRNQAAVGRDYSDQKTVFLKSLWNLTAQHSLYMK
ncbi:hypothetical protein [Endozoicomonas sp. YOMI1]|uniref:hypothetical protein n=1 Tax=Endozoicomonas sp. YOMI1 TaxID=2828739 RepID=UPI0021480584|nr:hypothetical protein [Endozoicomonas sp. YOMI1]